MLWQLAEPNMAYDATSRYAPVVPIVNSYLGIVLFAFVAFWLSTAYGPEVGIMCP